MPSTTTSSNTSTVSQSSLLSVNALVAGDKWGGVTGTGVNLTFSFPWTTAGSATFSGANGFGDYSSLNEQNASAHGLNAIQQVAARSALQSWANVANITFSEVADSSSNVGDIRFGWTSAALATGQSAWGWASLPSSYWPVGGDIWISSIASGAVNPDWSAGSYNFEALVHELGHALGLKHSFEGGQVLPTAQESRLYSVMSYTGIPNSLFRHTIANADGSYSFSYAIVNPDSPMLYDVAAMQYLYGANMSFKTGNDVGLCR